MSSVAVHRTAYDEPAPGGTDPFLPARALDIDVAFAAYTSGSAWVHHRDDANRVARGAVAARVRSTWVGGECVSEA